MEGSPLITVRTQVVLDTIVGSIAEAVTARFDDPLEPPVEAALALAGDDGEQRLARAGYLARVLELERFDRARQPMPWLAERLRVDGTTWSEAAATLAAELAETEPPERPDPGDDRAVSWKVPGPGGHVRHYLAVRAAGGEGHGGTLPLGAKRAWSMGFLIACIEETAS
jgi:hypothetical protein